MEQTTIDRQTYRADPCGASSLPFWKAAALSLPEGMRILRQDAFVGVPRGYVDAAYFKMLHRLNALAPPHIPAGYSWTALDTEGFAAHINACYDDIGVTAEELSQSRRRAVFRDDLRVALRCDADGEIAATGIGELDASLGEGTLEWIQVSPAHRRRGLGEAVVRELLRRMRPLADFVTVSGRADDPLRPAALYRRCGFEGKVLWHILRKTD